jgi:outer membrane protein OmpA-like peptidoglycan-associated protein
MRNFISAFLLILCISFNANAQSGDKYFKDKDYQRAVFAYEREVINNPALYLNLAKSYFALQNFEKAIDAITLYKAKYSGADKTYADQLLTLLQRDDELVKVENLGSVINTSDNNFLPRILQDGKTLFFLSKGRIGGAGGEDIWTSSLDETGNWSSPKNLSTLNTSTNEGVLSISPDEKVAILFGNYPGSFGSGDLFYSVKTENGWSNPCNLGGTINTNHWESLACIGPDGKTLIYSTETGDGNNSDLYVTFLSEDGWAKPINIGKTINTKQDEKYPFLSADGKTLYFSSDGHFGFGGTDMFMCRRLDDTWTNWSEPVNLGKYINTLDDDADLSIPASGKMAYIVRSNAPDGYGGSDIYRFLMPFNMRPEQLFKLYGTVTNEKDSAAQVNIKFIDMATNKEITKATSNELTGFYQAALPLNKKYLAVIDMKGFLYYSEVIDLTDPDKYRKRFTFQQKIALQRKRLDEIKLHLDSLNTKLSALNQSNNEKIRETFEQFEKITKEYKRSIEELDITVYKAKYDWMTENTEDLSLQKDFHVKRAKIGMTFELKNIFFDLGKATLREDSKKELDKLYEILSNSEIVIELGGHTDSIGSDDANQSLSQQRVNSVKTYLEEKGISNTRLMAVGYGEKFPVASNTTDAGRQLNRRVEVKILKLQQDVEGSDVVTQNDKNRKPETDESKAIKKGEMLPVLQAAARKGGLPSGSECNNVYVKPTTTTQTYVPPVSHSYSWLSKGDIDIDDNILKHFNAGILNSNYASLGSSNGAYIILVNKEKLHENHLEYFYQNPDKVKFGIGYTKYNMIRLKPTFGIPVNLIWGWELKYFNKDDVNANKQSYYHLNIPLGARVIFPVKGFIVGPEIIYNYGLASNTTAGMGNSTYTSIGATVRWKFIHAGINENIGSEINFVGYKLGVSF